MNPPVSRKLAWGLTLGGLGAALVFSGSPAAVKAVSVVAALPFTLVLILQVVALLRALAHDTAKESSK